MKTGQWKQVYLYDRGQSQTTLISATSQQQPATGDSMESAISADGGTVIFVSKAHDLLGLPVARAWQLYRFEVSTGKISLVTKTADGQPAGGAVSSPSLSADGKVVTFLCNASDLAGIRQSRRLKVGSPQMRLYACRLDELRFVPVGGHF